jgi:hypothetical protein
MRNTSLDTIRWALQTGGRCDLKNLLLVVALLAVLLAWPTLGLSQAGQVIPRVAPFGDFTRVSDKADPNSFSSFHFDGGQSVPIVGKYTVFGGFTTVRNRFDYGPTGSYGPGAAFYVNGWEASIEREFAPWIGIVADFSQQYGTASAGPPMEAQQEHQTFALFGPQFSLRATHRAIPFAHALMGPSYGHLGAPQFTFKAFDFTTAVGGGVDIRITRRVSIRAVQVDYLNTTTDFEGDHATLLRISAGIAFRF